MDLKIISVALLLLSQTTFAWNSAGHRVIAQIAYDQLTPTAKQQIDTLTAIQFHSKYPEERFLKAATWPDKIRGQTKQYNTWHYIDLPFIKDGEKPQAVNSDNVVTEIARAEKIVSDTSNSPERRAKYLSFLIHFVGDIHQPLHCATLYDKQFPQGDAGGNNYPINTAISNNLHWYWDEGLGLFYSVPGKYEFRYNQVEDLASQWMTQDPPAFYGAKLQDLSAVDWANDSYKIATTFIYQIPPHAIPSAQYIQQGQTIVREQAVLAGDRLAAVLNQIFK